MDKRIQQIADRLFKLGDYPEVPSVREALVFLYM